MPDQCPACGAQVEGGRESCQWLWYALSSSGVMPGPAFDAYCMQHLEKYCQSAKSYAAHLTRLCCGIEHGGDPRVYRAIQKWLNGKVALQKPPLLNNRGAMTIAEVKGGKSTMEQMKLATKWVNSVWVAYQPQHERARTWIKQALAGK